MFGPAVRLLCEICAGGGLTAERGAVREQLRMEAGERFAAGDDRGGWLVGART